MSAFQRATWHWPSDENDLGEEHIDPQIADEAPVEYPQEHGEQHDDADEADAAPRPQRHYPPRQCRICLEEVLPTYEPAAGGLPSILNPTPSVKYVSSDPSSGRLIRPCKCRGSQQYVHEGCLQLWRHSDPSMGNRYYWECPTCKFRYRLERMRWSRYISSTFTQIIITVAIMFLTVFVFGFIADPIINLYLDPIDTITSLPSGGKSAIQFEDEEGSWLEHFVKGLASLGMLGFVKVFFVLGPWQWFNIRNGGLLGGQRRRGGGRDRLEDISWTVVIIGIITFLAAVWTWVRAWTARTLEKAGERVADVQGDDDDFEETLEEAAASPAAAGPPPAAGDTSDQAFARAEAQKTE
ncbi:hypothetical protein L207DRAFT_507927 [Hyaloscypha variabilis F]|uniref:RING-CH-type domain-containing protein n=1 Tax=Hyaloscypha variabilis (strain UAMH 11265 / GT02V1 / F) TaxID=1149755 RepID=A0A2J6S2K8_HYAVF|nr:hypothetical protein L207DRAFT_507927 [Hyaloscypha variabilis F]